METPVGVALVVVDEKGVLRAFDFADYEPRMRKLMGRHYPGMELIPGRAPDPCASPSPVTSRVTWAPSTASPGPPTAPTSNARSGTRSARSRPAKP
uniref:Uncharacterized protein n=1 Tax=Phenylobacterium glaciei TaxID=2803784 RepID=A0A974S7K2_9CAUL|nr:hypothetical protein JKL49_19720 [Phenylobacterium glaciei]